MTLESTLENYVADYARKRGVLQVKLNVQSHRGWPDRAFFFPRGRLLFIEFKREPNWLLTQLQAHIHMELETRGFEVRTVWKKEVGRALIDAYLKGKTVPRV